MSSIIPSWACELTFPSNMERAHSLIDEIMSELRRMPWSDRELFAIQLSLEEGLINAITHGNKGNPEKKVRFSYTLSDEVTRFRIEDEGDGFDVNAVPDPTSIDNIENASGRGVLLVRSFMTNVTFNETGNVLTMEKVRARECQDVKTA
ncbi:MAG: ATP-binding protein [Planctomycetaceae bacterium]|jgi:serine/threonine-protein kinase RsbW|nr:ATP-binding protein [Planctomycetaceae bacterium]